MENSSHNNFNTWWCEIENNYHNFYEVRPGLIPKYNWRNLFNEGYTPETAIEYYYKEGKHHEK